MKFVADEDVDWPIVECLRQRGHEVWYVAEMETGIDDEVVLNLARSEEALLLTADKGFGELIFRQQKLTAGVILVRLEGLSPGKKAEVVALAIQQHMDTLFQKFTVISPGNIRIRRREE